MIAAMFGVGSTKAAIRDGQRSLARSNNLALRMSKIAERTAARRSALRTARLPAMLGGYQRNRRHEVEYRRPPGTAWAG